MQKFHFIIFLFVSLILVKGQQKDSVYIQNEPYRFQAKQLIIPATLMAAGTGILLTEKRDVPVDTNKDFLAFGGYFEDYAQFAPHAAAYAFELGGMKPRTDFWNRSAILAKGEIITFVAVTGLKYIFKQPRPDGSNEFGFPSGHTANAFAGATFLTIEYGERYKWVPYAAYGIAAGVGALRFSHNKHYWSDVVFGAGLGILTMKAAYWTHQYKWGKKNADFNVFNAIYNQHTLSSIK